MAKILDLPAEAFGFGAHQPSRFVVNEEFVFVPLASPLWLEKAATPKEEADKIVLYGKEGDKSFQLRLLAEGNQDTAARAAIAFAGALARFEHQNDPSVCVSLTMQDAQNRVRHMALTAERESGELANVVLGGPMVILAQGILTL